MFYFLIPFNILGVPAMDYYMVEIFESSSMKFNSSWAAIIVRMAEIISKSNEIMFFLKTECTKITLIFHLVNIDILENK